MHPLLYYYYYIAILLPYCPPRSPPCNLTSDTPPPSRPRGRDILPSHPQVPLPSLTFQGRYIPLSSLSSLSFQSRNIPPSSLSLQGRDIPLSLPPATFQEGTLITDGSDRFLGGTRWCVPVWRTYDTKLDVCDKIWQRIGVAAKTELSFEKLWRFSGRNLHIVNLYYAKPRLQMILIVHPVDEASTSERGIMIWRGLRILRRTSIIGYCF